MTTHIALLRGINVGGRKMVAMADLRDLLTQLGFADARSLLRSGNLVFRSDKRTAAQLERLLEAERDPGHLLVLFLKDALATKDVKALQAAITGPELVRAEGRQACLVYPDGIGRSRLTNTLIEKHIGRGTGRNWNTVLKLAAFTK